MSNSLVQLITPHHYTGYGNDLDQLEVPYDKTDRASMVHDFMYKFLLRNNDKLHVYLGSPVSEPADAWHMKNSDNSVTGLSSKAIWFAKHLAQGNYPARNSAFETEFFNWFKHEHPDHYSLYLSGKTINMGKRIYVDQKGQPGYEKYQKISAALQAQQDAHKAFESELKSNESMQVDPVAMPKIKLMFNQAVRPNARARKIFKRKLKSRKPARSKSTARKAKRNPYLRRKRRVLRRRGKYRIRNRRRRRY